MYLKVKHVLCWYQVWSFIWLSSIINSGNCPTKCNGCRFNSVGDLIAATCKDVQIPALPKTLEELKVSDAAGMNAIMFRQFRSFVLTGMSELTVLKIQNYRISTLNGDCFRGSPGLKTLDLSSNLISQIAEINFKGLTNLTSLNLNKNKLTKLGDFVFRQLVSLESLYIALNNLDLIGQSDFAGLKRVKTIDLQSNKIKSIHMSAFQGLLSLETINLQTNELTKIEVGQFGNLPNLKTLSLQTNKISYMDPKSMTNTPVTYLNLMTNELTKIPTKFLQEVSSLNLEVNLARNNITRIDAGDLQRISLKTLFLVANVIAFVHPDAMCDSFIQRLDLEQNLLRHLPEGLQNSLNQSNTVILHNNPWSCDCAIQWMQSLIRKDIPEPVCAQPLSYRGQKLSQITDDLKIACGNLATLPVPTMHFPVPPRLNPVTPHLETKTTTCQTTTTTTKQHTTEMEVTEQKGGNSTIPVVAGAVCGLLFLVAVVIGIVVFSKTNKKVKVAPEFSINCKKPDLNFKPVLKYAPQKNEFCNI